MLWAGADPLAPGEAEPGRELDSEDGGLSALGFAALYGHFDVFSLKQVKIPVDHPSTRDLLQYACQGEGLPVIESLLSKGLNPNDQPNGGSSAIQRLLESLEWSCSRDYFNAIGNDRNGDSARAREKLKAIHLLAKHGALWRPTDKNATNSARRSLLKMSPDYTVEFAWIMQKYGGCARDSVSDLIRTPTMKRHLSRHMGRLREILVSWSKESGGMAEDGSEEGTSGCAECDC